MIVSGAEQTDIVLKPPKSTKACSSSLWFKYQGSNNYPRLAQLKDDKSLWYYGDFCFQNTVPCSKSPKLEMDSTSRDLIVYSLELSDESDYYYFCGETNQWPTYHLLKLDVYGKIQ